MKKILFFLLLSLSFSRLMAQSMEWLCRPGTFADIQYMGYDLFNNTSVNFYRKIKS